MEPPYVHIGSEAVAEAYLQSHGHWTVANLTQSIGWTQKLTTVEFRGKTLALLPEDDKNLPAIATLGDDENTRRLVMEFASALTWAEHGEVTIESWSGGSRPFRASKHRLVGQVSAVHFRVDYLPAPVDANGKLALALFHEGSSLARIHVAYSFLSFYKIINLIAGKKGKAQISWINRHVGEIANHMSRGRLQELQANQVNVGQYLYESCRCAIAHAGDPNHPVVDPHNLQDQRRLHADLPLVIALAKIAMEKELGIKTSQTIYKEHRYELSGFEALFGTAFVEKVVSDETIDGSLDIPLLSIRMWGKPSYTPLTDMTPTAIEIDKGVLSILCESKSKRYIAILELDFKEYRLRAEVGPKRTCIDDGSAEYIDELIEIEKYFWDYNCNGCLEVWSDEGECLGRCDAFMPVNVILDPKGHKNRQEQLNTEATRRRST